MIKDVADTSHNPIWKSLYSCRWMKSRLSVQCMAFEIAARFQVQLDVIFLPSWNFHLGVIS